MDLARRMPLFDLTGRVALVTGRLARPWPCHGASRSPPPAPASSLNGRDARTLEPRRARAAPMGLLAETVRVRRHRRGRLGRRDRSDRRGDTGVSTSSSAMPARSCASRCSNRPTRNGAASVEADLTAGWRLAREAARLMIPASARPDRLHVVDHGRVARPSITGYVAAKAGLERAGARARRRAGAARHHRQRARARLLSDRGQQRSQARPIRGSKGGSPRARRPARWGRLDELGAAALYLASPLPAYTTGTVLTVDGGLTASL